MVFFGFMGVLLVLRGVWRCCGRTACESCAQSRESAVASVSYRHANPLRPAHHRCKFLCTRRSTRPVEALMATSLVSAKELAAKRKPRFTSESSAYARAREALLAEEIEVRRHLGRLARQNRELPEGPEVSDG